MGIDPIAKTVRFEDRPEIDYDVLSINVGSTTRGAEIPGAREHAMMTRPIGELLAKIETFEAAHPKFERAPRVVVVGGGAAGVELAFAFLARFKKRYGDCHVALIGSNPEPLENRGSWTSRLVRKALGEKGIQQHFGVEALKVEPGVLSLTDGSTAPFDLLVWATGGAAPALAAKSGLETGERGFIKVRSTLQSLKFDDVFAAGDCIQLDGYPALAKSGVYAVREGPYLARNIEAYLRKTSLQKYVPQRGFNALLMTGDGSAIASWKGLSARGKWVWRWKDSIDRRFMDMFNPELISDAPMRRRARRCKRREVLSKEIFRCAGCGGKVGGTVLSQALESLKIETHSRVRIGLDAPDDAAVFEVPAGRDVVQTIDHFRAFFDDPYLIGRIAAVHAASDIFAMGAQPDTVLAFATIPHASDDLVKRDLRALMAGIVRETNAMGAALVGGHTSEAAELSVGLVVNGLIDPAKILAKKGLRPGDRLILTKALGTGAILAADMRGMPVGPSVKAAVFSMLQSNARGAEILIQIGARAMTDVTGFGLAVHLTEMLEASAASAWISLANIPALGGVAACFKRGVVSSLHDSNRRHLHHRWDVSGDTQPGAEIVYDPQTSGGLLAGVQAESANETLRRLRDAGYSHAAEIGEVIESPRDERGRLEIRSAK